jgi:glutathione S-transferase
MADYRIIGIESSPYAVKVRAVMRYRRLPHLWVACMPQFFAETAGVRPLLMPVVQFPDGEYRTDSTPIIHALERVHPAVRSVIPDDPGAAFVSDLLEDMADEWLTKSLFHYRFSHVPDQLSAGSWVMDDAHPGLAAAELEQRASAFVARQRSRMGLVGCTPENGPLLERFYVATCEALEKTAATDRFLFGSRPALADFGLYGQLCTLAADPTPGSWMRAHAPRLNNWIKRVDELSGIEGEWYGGCANWPDTVGELVSLAGRFYLPFLSANARAIEDGDDTVEVELDGHHYRQPVYRYQGKCRDFLVRRFAGLEPLVRDELSQWLADRKCLEHLQPI